MEEGFVSPQELLRRFDTCVAAKNCKRIKFDECTAGVAVEKGDLILGWDAIPVLYRFCWTNAKKVRSSSDSLVMQLTLPVVAINPANSTALNMRKECLVKGVAEKQMLVRELELTTLIQTKHVKEGDLFFHRQVFFFSFLSLFLSVF